MGTKDAASSDPTGWREEAPAPSEDRETRLRRLKIRCWRRGVREMDLILGGFLDQEAPGLEDAALDVFEELVRHNDADLYAWVSGAAAAPAEFATLVARLSARAEQLGAVRAN